MLSANHPQNHFEVITDEGNVTRIWINMENFISEIILGADIFLNAINTKWQQQATPELRLNIGFIAGMINYGFTGRLIDDGALDSFNPKLRESPLQITKSELVEEIRLLYEKAKSTQTEVLV